MSEDPQKRLDVFRQAAGRFASGVTVVTTENEGYLYGLTATSFVSLSLNPLLVTVSVNLHSPILDEIRQSGHFAINVLASDQQHVSAYFATRGRGRSEGSFDTIDTRVESTGAPIVNGALSWFDCTVYTTLDGGDHTILVGEVAAAGGGTGEPLMYMSGKYRALSPAEEQAEEQRAAEADIQRIADSLSIQLHMHGMSAQQLLEAQQALEPAAAALAARNATPSQIAGLRALLDEAESVVDDAVRWNPLAMEFHVRLGRISGNPAIDACVQALSQPRENVLAPHTVTERAQRTVAAFREVVEAIATGDDEGARRLMGAHLARVSENLPR